MTPKNLFNIILKVLGIFFLKDVVSLIINLLFGWLYLSKEATASDYLTGYIATIFSLIVYLIVTYVLIFKTSFLIKKMKLEESLGVEEIPLNIHRSTILSITVMVIAGIILVDNVPVLCNALISYYTEYKEKKITMSFDKASPQYVFLYAAKIVVGLLLLSNQRQIVNYIEYRSRKRSE